jgi:hypothetical protein
VLRCEGDKFVTESCRVPHPQCRYDARRGASGAQGPGNGTAITTSALTGESLRRSRAMYQLFWKMLVASPSAMSTATDTPPRPSSCIWHEGYCSLNGGGPQCRMNQ